ncbi:hypothetical protein XELAEV_18043060mg [Xenopus laevis]|uniref:Uncharacterized protein n=1 Tax=Xenopus laevis TaxID=8355 RepID=A0A974BWC4_XENLA|nr:hypothetical protein XELAEV_18043060mg [Xenopus laevis]
MSTSPLTNGSNHLQSLCHRLEETNTALLWRMMEEEELAMKSASQQLGQYSRTGNISQAVLSWRECQQQDAQKDLRKLREQREECLQGLRLQIQACNEELHRAQENLQRLREYQDRQQPMFLLQIADLQRQILRYNQANKVLLLICPNPSPSSLPLPLPLVICSPGPPLSLPPPPSLPLPLNTPPIFPPANPNLTPLLPYLTFIFSLGHPFPHVFSCIFLLAHLSFSPFSPLLSLLCLFPPTQDQEADIELLANTEMQKCLERHQKLQFQALQGIADVRPSVCLSM